MGASIRCQARVSASAWLNYRQNGMLFLPADGQHCRIASWCKMQEPCSAQESASQVVQQPAFQGKLNDGWWGCIGLQLGYELCGVV